MDQAISVIYLI